jgi:hypothetical protein
MYFFPGRWLPPWTHVYVCHKVEKERKGRAYSSASWALHSTQPHWSLCLRVVRRVGGGIPLSSTRRRLGVCANGSFDTSATGCPCQRVVRHVSDGLPVPTYRARRQLRTPYANVSFDTLALGTHTPSLLVVAVF